MAKINVLDSSIYNLISAGEVVERPASVVKELVENAVDAGAKNIKIEITNGGKSKIKVTDDGAGMDASDLETAFLPHATSKITDKNDLFEIKTLGFRGEALPSIAAVAMVTAVSKTADADGAHGVELRGGSIVNRFISAGVTGTTVTAENIFFATPARLKFLKKDKSEELEITSLIQNLILANPFVAFTYVADGKTIYQTQGDGLKNAILSVFSREITTNFVEIENTLNGFSISGYVSNPTYFKGNRSYQTIILNGRVIANKTIMTAVEKAYEPFLMKRSYPLYVLNINMPLDTLDVNVHPSKADVRFADNQSVFSFVYHSVQRVLMTYDNIKSVPQLEYVEDTVNFAEQQLHNAEIKAETATEIKETEIKETDNNKDNYQYDTAFNGFFKRNSAASDDGGAFYRMLKNRMATENVVKEDSVQQNIFGDAEISATESFNFSGKVIGQLFETYLLVEKDDNLYVIDQHAAHERMLYDKLVSNENSFSQPLLIPYIYTANPTEYDFITGCIHDLNNIGFDIEEFSNLTFKVSAVPEVLTDINFDKFFVYLTNDLIKTTIKANDVLKEKLMQTACKSAIKAGDTLNNDQIASLIKAFSDADNKPLQCPHGRPTVIKFTKVDFEKWFKRIV